jgi:hypothetical protein
MRSTIAVPMLLILACGGSTAVSPDDTTAEGHRREAARERGAAHDEIEVHRAAEEAPGGSSALVNRGAFSSGGQWQYPQQSYDPHAFHIDAAAAHSSHARAHEAAAQELEHFEDAECAELPPETRAACPILGPAVGWKAIDRGVEVTFPERVPVAAVIAHMRCHQAFARAHGYTGACPLYMKGLHIAPSAAGHAVLLTVDALGDAAALRKRAKEEIVVGKPATVL